MNNYGADLIDPIISDTAALQNVDLLAADFQLKRGGTKVRMSISATAVSLRLVPSSGSALVLSAALTASTLTTFEFLLDASRTWNLQSDNAAGITVDFLAIQEVDA